MIVGGNFPKEHYPIQRDTPIPLCPSSSRIFPDRILHAWYLFLHPILSCLYLVSPDMESDRDPSYVDGFATERRPLLSSPHLANSHLDRDTAEEIDNAVAFRTVLHTSLDFRAKLGASAFNFFLSGIAMAAVGVSIIAYSIS